MNRILLTAGILAAAVLTPGLAAADDTRTDSIRAAVIGVPQGTLPTLHFHAPGKLLVQHLAEPLVAYRNDLSIAPVLADSWTVSSDGRRYRFRLRDDARFHNGSAVRAEHVVSNWQALYLNTDFAWDCRPYYDGSGSIEARTTGVAIESVTAIDELTVEFNLRRPNSLFLHRLADVSCGPVVFHPDSFDRDGQWTTLIGSGPYRLANPELGRHIDLVRFEEYRARPEPRDAYGGSREALLDTVSLEVYDSTEEALAALRSGEVDYVQGISTAQRLDVLEDPALAVATTANVTYWTLLMQTSDPVLGDVNLRRGIAKAIDVERIALAVSGHRSTGHGSVVSAQSMYYTASQARRHDFDPRAARALLRETGYGGEAVAIQCARDTYPDSCLIAELAQSMMRDAGINAEVRPMSWKALKDDHYQSGRYQMQAFIIGGRTSPTQAYGKFIGEKADNPRFYWENDNAFALLEDAERARSVDELRSIYDRLHGMMLDDVPQIVVMNREHHDAYRVGFSGIQPTHFGRIAFWGVSRNAAH